MQVRPGTFDLDNEALRAQMRAVILSVSDSELGGEINFPMNDEALRSQMIEWYPDFPADLNYLKGSCLWAIWVGNCPNFSSELRCAILKRAIKRLEPCLEVDSTLLFVALYNIYVRLVGGGDF